MQLLIKAKLLDLKGYFEEFFREELEKAFEALKKLEKYYGTLRYFLNFIECAKEVKRTLTDNLADYRVYVFGSVIRNDYSRGLSDIDITIVSEEFER